jgi:hypothetical protein
MAHLILEFFPNYFNPVFLFPIISGPSTQKTYITCRQFGQQQIEVAVGRQPQWQQQK